MQHNFFEHHDPTIEDAYQQRTVIDSEPCLLDILDTAGQVEFTAMREQYMRCGEGFIVCFSIADRHSFLECEEYRNLILKVRAQDNVPIILVANKVDLDQGGIIKSWNVYFILYSNSLKNISILTRCRRIYWIY